MQAQGTGRGPVFSLFRDTNYRNFWYVGGLTWTSFGLELLVLSWFVLLAARPRNSTGEVSRV